VVSNQETRPVQVGDLVPDFILPTQTGESVRLHDMLGKSTIVLFFYPKDDTGGCTVEVCSFRDSYEVFKNAGAEVIGVSSDTIVSHQKFIQKHHLPFILLSDQGGLVRKLFGTPTTLGILPGRVTYVIDKQGIVRHIFSSQFQPTKHISEALHTIQNLASLRDRCDDRIDFLR
jgi:thioredoxin-dependent peroxiredoxin